PRGDAAQPVGGGDRWRAGARRAAAVRRDPRGDLPAQLVPGERAARDRAHQAGRSRRCDRRVGARPRSVPGARHRRSPARPASGGMTALLEVRGLIKVYPGVTALDGVDLDVAAGEVHCLVGQNGAGKSTLIKCVAGAATPTAGTIRLDGHDLTTGRPGAALSAGVATIYQELDLVGDLSVADNIFLGHERRSGPLLDRRRMRREAGELLGRLGHPRLDPDARVGELRPADKQIVSMARALSRDVRLLIMDEPSAILDPPEVDALFEVVH